MVIIYSNTAEIIIYLDPLVDLQPISSQTICVGGSSQQLDVSYINGVGTATISGMRIRLITIVVVLLFQEQLVVVIRHLFLIL